MKYTNIDLVRGDDSFIPVVVDIPVGSINIIQLRQYPEAVNYFILEIIDNKIFIPASITINLSGHYELEIESNLDGITTTLQHTNIDFIPDVTRLYGDIEPILNQDLEREKIIAKQYLIKDNEGNITNLGNSTFRYVQNLASTVWNIQHNLGKYPSVSVTDSAGTIVEGRTTYIDANNVLVEFNAEFTGFANCN